MSAIKSKLAKNIQIRVQVGQDVDIQKLIGQVNTYVNKSKMKDRIEIHINGEPQVDQPVADEGTDLL